MRPKVINRRRVAGLVALSTLTATAAVGVAPAASAAESAIVSFIGNPCVRADQTLSHWRVIIDDGWSGTVWANASRSVWTTLPAGRHHFVIQAWCGTPSYGWYPALGAAGTRWIGAPGFTYVAFWEGTITP